MSKVALVRGTDRYANVNESLRLIKDDLASKLSDKKTIVIKPNFVTVYNQLAATHVDAVRAVLDMIARLSNRAVTVAEGAAMGSTKEGFKKYGYYNLQKKFNLCFVDLNQDAFRLVEIFVASLKPLKLKVAKTILDSEFRISVAPMKTHDTVVVSLALKNMLVGSLCGIKAKTSIHQSYYAINQILFKLAQIIPPHLSIIDGFIAMEGDGPTHGVPVEMGVAVCSTDFLAADIVAAHLMGFDIDQIGYLYYCKKAKLGEGDLSKMEIVGNVTLEECRREFRPHSTFQSQLAWRIE